ncbi:MAG: O-antigen ligase family protein [Acidobacteriota bacterium]|nr:O-antigen ligase family protein [Acidobacteriota bacterium]
MIAVGDRVRRLAAAAGWITLLVPLALVLLSVGLSPDSNWTVRALLAGFVALAVVQPPAAFLITLALLGFGTILAHMAGVPTLRVTELLIIGSLFGCAVRALSSASIYRGAIVRGISTPVVLFALAAVTSTAVWLRVLQVELMYPSEFLALLFRFLSRNYFIQPDEFWLVISGAVILEGLALYVAVAALCRVDPTFFERGLRMLTLGGAVLAVTSAVKLAEIYLGNPGAIETLRATPNGLRISPQIPDFIAAGSYFGLCWVATLGLAVAGFAGHRQTQLPTSNSQLTTSKRRPSNNPAARLDRRGLGVGDWLLGVAREAGPGLARGAGVIWLLAGVPLIVALYLTGSRSVIAAALAGLVVLVLMLIRQGAAAARSLVAFGIIAAVVMVIGYPWWTGRDLSGVMARQSLYVRAELMKTGLRVIETRPLFGVGIDRFHLLAGGLASPDLHALFPARKNPHNDFLRFATELGLVGLALFLWILIAAARVIWRALRESRDARLAGLVGGIIVFLVTSMVSNPLMVREVSYVFWIALGLAVGRSTVIQSPRLDNAPRTTVAVGGRRRWSSGPVGLLVGGLLVFSVPLRARQELAETNLSHVSYGLFEWGNDPDGTRSRWSRPEFTLFVDGRALLVEIPLSGIALRSNALRQVEIRVDGRLVNRVPVGAEWQRVRTPLPGGPRTESWRLDFVVSPSWIPAEEIEGSDDRRVLGVKVGELKVIMVPD